MQPKEYWCYYCKHAGKPFKMSDGTNLHCEHPNPNVAGEPGWATLRRYYETCPKWEKKECKK